MDNAELEKDFKSSDWTAIYRISDTIAAQSDAENKSKSIRTELADDNSPWQAVHTHDHQLENEFMHLSEEGKIKACETNFLLGKYFLQECNVHTAAGHFELVIALSFYCFPDETKDINNVTYLVLQAKIMLCRCCLVVKSYRSVITGCDDVISTISSNSNDIDSVKSSELITESRVLKALALRELHEYEYVLCISFQSSIF